MAGRAPHGAAGEAGHADWFHPVAEMFRVRGYVTLSVRIGYDLVLIVSGPAGEAAIIDLSEHTSSLWREAWAGMRQVLPRVPVVAIVPSTNDMGFDIDSRTPLTRVRSPVEPETLVQAVDQLLSPPGTP